MIDKNNLNKKTPAAVCLAPCIPQPLKDKFKARTPKTNVYKELVYDRSESFTEDGFKSQVSVLMKALSPIGIEP